MDFQASPWMNAELELYKDNVRRFIKAQVVPYQEKWRSQHYVDRALWRKAGELGLLLADIPEQYGGSGGTFAHMSVFWEELIAADETGIGTHVHSVVAHYILNSGTEAQKMAYLPRLANGELIAAIAVTEAGAGSDLQGIRTAAVRRDDYFVINGSKTFVSNGTLADLVLLAVKTDPAAGARGISVFLLETKDLQGYRVGRILEMIGRRAQDTSEVFLDDVKVPVEALLGGVEGRGVSQLGKGLAYERIAIGVAAVAAMERATALAVEYTRERKAFGKPLFDLQNTRIKLAEAKTQSVVARVFIDWCIHKMISGTMEPDVASMAKWYLSDMQCKLIDECLQLFGGYGYSMEFPIARMYADARVQKIYGGANEVMKEIIAYAI